MNNYINDIQEFENNLKISESNRFLKSYHLQKFFIPNFCEWIIYETEKYAKENNGWDSRPFSHNPPQSLEIKKITNISNIVHESFSVIIPIIKNIYNLNNIKLEINYLFIVKYIHNMQNKFNFHTDGSLISCNILLNDENEFDGGGTSFEDGKIYNTKQGDLLLHCGKIKHAGVEITRGTRYVLVGFFNLTHLS